MATQSTDTNPSRQPDWQAAMAEAELQLIKAHRAEHLGTQLRRWQEAAAIRAMIATVAANEATEPHSDWIEWARRYANEIDPSVTGLTPPPAPKITPETLRPFLGRWSPHGPDG